MKLTKFLPATLMAGALLFAATACSPAAPPVKVQDTPEKAIAKTVNGFYDTLESEDNYDAMEKHKDAYSAAAWEEKPNVMVQAPGMEYLDISTVEARQTSYMMLTSSVDSFEQTRGRFKSDGANLNKLNIEIPESAITVNGDTAEVDMKKAVISFNGKGIDNSTSKAPDLFMKKVDENKWVISVENLLSDK